MKALQTLPRVTDRVGRYQVLSDLGRGSMAQVYLALDPNIDREVALKVFLPRYEVGPEELAEMRRRFIAEAKAAGRVSHPGVVTIYDADTDVERDLSYIAMERIEGRSLWEILADDGPLPELPAVEIMAKVALALHAAHEDGLVHLDVKPGNILCSLDGSIKVTDFGIAQLATASRNQTDWISGSPFYMSPEQLAGGEVDARSDVYSLGAVFYECLCGAVPFTSESIAGLRYMIEEIDPRPLQTFDSRIRGELACVAMKALSKSPADRFQTTYEMAEALHSAMAVAPILVQAGRTNALAPSPQGLGSGVLSVPAESPEPAVGVIPPITVVESARTERVPRRPRTVPAPPADKPAERPTEKEVAPSRSVAQPSSPAGTTRAAGDSVPPPIAGAPGVRRRVVAPILVLVLVVSAVLGALAYEAGWLDDFAADVPGVSAVAASQPQPVGEQVTVWPVARYSPAPYAAVALDRYNLADPPPTPAEIEIAEAERSAALRRRRETARQLVREATQERAEEPSPAAAAGSFLSESELRPVEEPSPPPPEATLEILFRNRLKGGSVAVWIDGERAWNESFSGARNVFRRTVGKDITMSLPVLAGEHEIEVRVTGANGKLDESRRTRATFEPDETLRLRLVHVPPGGLRLSWKELDGE